MPVRAPRRAATRHGALVAAVVGLLLGVAVPAVAGFTRAVSAAQQISTAILVPQTGLTATGSLPVSLSWTATTSSVATGTRVLRGSTSGGPYTRIAQLAGLGTTTYSDSTGSGIYYYVVVAYYSGNGANWTSAVSTEVRHNSCVAGSTTVTADADTYTDSGNITRNNGGTTTVSIQGQSGHYRRGYVHVVLPTLGAGCGLSAATLQPYQSNSATGHTYYLYLAGAAWTEAGLTWSNQPALAGTPVTVVGDATTGYRSFDVTGNVQTLYAGTNTGFVIVDSGDLGGGNVAGGFAFAARSTTTPETLTVTWVAL